ncbi:MAG: RHS repeat protein [Verrucomicrobia bacterium]|nr:RHS repeat protein [Verrucomicrobiota bacterium]
MTGGFSYNFSYSYNVDGTLQSQTYPSNRVVNYAYDAAGRPLSAAATAPYASAIS